MTRLEQREKELLNELSAVRIALRNQHNPESAPMAQEGCAPQAGLRADAPNYLRQLASHKRRDAAALDVAAKVFEGAIQMGTPPDALQVALDTLRSQ